MGGTFDRDLKRHLTEAGCRFIRHGKGSHEIWFSPRTGRNISVPTGILSRHTANAVLKQAGIDERF